LGLPFGFAFSRICISPKKMMLSLFSIRLLTKKGDAAGLGKKRWKMGLGFLGGPMCLIQG
jgi:hypothetical protein